MGNIRNPENDLPLSSGNMSTEIVLRESVDESRCTKRPLSRESVTPDSTTSGTAEIEAMKPYVSECDEDPEVSDDELVRNGRNEVFDFSSTSIDTTEPPRKEAEAMF